MKENKLDKNAKKSWIVSRGIGTVITTAILFIIKFLLVSVFKVNFFMKYNKEINIFIAIIVVFLLLNFLIYPFIEYKQWRYIITKDKVQFSEGIYYTKTTLIPIVRIQHIRINQGPINKILNLANVSIFTAGGSHDIPNLSIEKANDISEFLKDKIKEKVDKDDK